MIPPQRLLFTVGGLALYLLVNHFVALPGVERIEGMHISVFRLGFMPFLTAFVLVELNNLLTRAGRQLRRRGRAGRRTLTRIGVVLGVLLALVQGVGMAMFLSKIQTPGGGLLVAAPGPLFILMTGLTLAAGSVAVYALGRAMSAWGIGNGFCWLWAIGLLGAIFESVISIKREAQVAGHPLIADLMVLGIVAVGMVVFFRMRETIEVTDADMENHEVEVPTLPQGVLPLLLAFALVGLPADLTFLAEFNLLKDLAESTDVATLSWLWAALTLLLVLALSYLGLYLFSSPKRVLEHLGSRILTRPQALTDPLWRQLWKAAALLLAGTVLEIAAVWFWERPITDLLGFVGLVSLVAIGLDVAEEWRFWQHNPEGAALAELDNVHLAAYLGQRLEEEGIPHAVQTGRYRSLFFFFAPLFKMRVLVAANDLDRAQQIFEDLDPEIF